MNQEQVKEKLLQLNRNAEDFSLLFSGKKSRKVNGLYKPESREIIIHNRNFNDDNPLIYTAIHEFAHHIHFTGAAVPISSRAHTKEFWGIFHSLLYKAEEKGVYINIFEKNKDFIELTGEIKNNYLSKNGELMKDLGRLLIKAIKLCEEHSIIGGLGSAILEVLEDTKDVVVKRIGMKDCFGESGLPEDLFKKYGLSGEKIAGTVEEKILE